MANQADAMASGRAASLERRPSIANGAAGPGKPNPEFEGRKMLGTGYRLAIGRIAPDPDQPRKTFEPDALDRLADNMRKRGQLVPILVRWSAEADRYIVIDGERRYRAAIMANLADMACVVENESDPGEILEMQLIANALREEVEPVEQARAYQRLMTSKDMTYRELGSLLNIDYSAIGKALKLLDLAPDIQTRVDAGELPASTAVQIARIDDHAEQRSVADRAVAEKMSRADVATAVEKVRPRATAPARSKGKPAKAKPVTSRTFKLPGGYRIEVSRAKGLDPLALAEALRSALAEVEADVIKNR